MGLVSHQVPVLERSFSDWPYLYSEDCSLVVHFAPSFCSMFNILESWLAYVSHLHNNIAQLVVLEPGLHPHSRQMQAWFDERFRPVVKGDIICSFSSGVNLLYDYALFDEYHIDYYQKLVSTIEVTRLTHR